MIDFQTIHARHLQVFREFIEFRRESVLPTKPLQAKIERIKRINLQTQKMIEKGTSLLPKGLIGQRVDLLI
jgi:hypothetical protein